MCFFLLVLPILTPRKGPSCEFHITSGDAKKLLMVALTGQPFTPLKVYLRCLSISLNSGAPEDRSNS